MKTDETRDEQSTEAVKVTAPPAPTITIDAQNPLPEPNFTHRRIITYIVVISTLAMVAAANYYFHTLEAPEQMYKLTRLQIGFAALIATYYYIAPSATELTNMIQSASIIKKGVEVAVESGRNAVNQGRQSRFDDRMDRESRNRDARLSEAPSAPEEIDAAPTGRR